MLPLIFPGFLSSSIIGRAPWPPSLDGPGPWISRVRPILARISQDLSYPPGASHRHASRPSLPFSTRIPTGVRTDSGEEREIQSVERELEGPQLRAGTTHAPVCGTQISPTLRHVFGALTQPLASAPLSAGLHV